MQQRSQPAAGALSSLPPVNRSPGTGRDITSTKSPVNSRFSKPQTAPHESTRRSRSPGSNSANNAQQQSARCYSAGSAPTATLSVAQYATAGAEALQMQVQLVQDAVCACQAAYNKAKSDVNKCTERIKQLQQQVSSLEAENKQLSARVPLPVNRLCRVRQWLGERNAELATEQAALEGKQMALLKTESQLRARETEADLLAEAAGGLSSATATEAAAAVKAAAASHAVEVEAAGRLLKKMHRQQQQAEQQEAEAQAEAAQRLKAAEEGQAAARQRLAASQAAMRAAAAVVDEAAAADEQQKRQALLSLKGKIDEVREAVGKRADKFRQLQKQKREQEKRDFEALQEQGLNPYEVYRRRDGESAAAKSAAELAVGQAQRMAKIAAVLEAEDKEYRQQLKRQEFDRQVEEEYQRNMGNAAQQQRTDAYMRGHTLWGQVLLDPTSRLHPYPSQSVLVKPAGFGLGRSSPEAVSKVANRHTGMQQDLTHSLLLPRSYRQGLEDSCRNTGGGLAAVTDEERECGHWPESAVKDTAAVDDSEKCEGVEGSTKEASGSEDEGSDLVLHSSSTRRAGSNKGSMKGSLAVAKLSKLETARLQQLKQTHKAMVAQPKTSFGRTFASDAFIADPAEVVFKDFVPGVTYKVAVQLINRSFCKNSIRLLEVPAEVAEVVELDMPPSGGLATGASATLKVTFTPKVDGDLAASIPLLAETGPLSLPLRCLARRAVPSVDPCPLVCLDGKAGGVMLAATGHKTVTISNAGALAVMYDVKVTGPLASTTEYFEPDPPLPLPNATAADMAELHAKAWAETSLAVAGFKVQGIKGQVQGYGSCTFSVEFTPRVSGVVEVPLLVRFTAPDMKALMLSPAQLTLTATGKDLPVSTSTPLIDFKSTMYNQQYAAQLVLSNAGKSAMKALVCSRPELNEWVTFMPDFGFIQAGDTLSVSVSLKPTTDMRSRLSKYLLTDTADQQGVYEVPLQVSVTGQTLPVPFKLRFQPTTTDLTLSPPLLDFGRVPLNESAGVQLTITNPSLLPQRFSFGSKLPLGLSISPNEGYGRVLPGENLQLLAKFQPPVPGLQYFGLTCRTLAGRVFKVEGKCEGLELDVILSHNSIKFPATEVDDINSASVILYNKGGRQQLFEFGVPTGSYLQITPRVGCLRPHSSIRIQLDFAPPQALMQQEATATVTFKDASSACVSSAESETATLGAASNAGAGGRASTHLKQPDLQQQQIVGDVPIPGSSRGSSSSSNCCNRWFWFKEWLIPCYVRPAEAHDDLTALGITRTNQTDSSVSSGSSLAVADAAALRLDSKATTNSSSSSSSSVDVLHLSVTTCAVAPELHLASPELPKPPGKNYFVMDFGALPVGERVTKQPEVANSGSDVVPLSCAPLDTAGIFTIVTALRPIQANSSTKILLAFSPQACTEYYEMLILRSAKSRFRIALKGRGIAPTVSISPATATSSTGGLNFGDVLLSDPISKEMKVTVTNTCPFTITYSTRFIGPAPAAGASNVTGSIACTAGVPGSATGTTGVAMGSSSSTGASLSAAAAGVRLKPAAGAAAQSPSATPAPVAVVVSGPSAVAAAAAAATPAAPSATAADPVAPSGCFYCKPCSGVLEAGQSQDLTVVLAPTRPNGDGLGPLSPYMSDRLQVLVPYQQQDVVVPLQAAVWPYGVFVAGVHYSSQSKLRGCGTSTASSSPSQQTAAAAVVPAVVDPFAAVLAAAAAMGAPTGAAATAAAASKGKATTAGPPQSGQQQQQVLVPSSAAGTAAALSAAGFCDLTQGCVILPGPVVPGQISSVTLEFGAVKSSTGALPGELSIDELPAAAKEAGWSLDSLKVAAPAGERKPLTVKYTAPALEKLKVLQLSSAAANSGTAAVPSSQSSTQGVTQGALAELGLPLEQSVKLSCTLKGGCLPVPGILAAAVAPPVGSDGLRRLTISCNCVVVVPPVV